MICKFDDRIDADNILCILFLFVQISYSYFLPSDMQQVPLRQSLSGSNVGTGLARKLVFISCADIHLKNYTNI